MAARMTVKYIDFDGDTSQASFDNNAALAGANFDANAALADALVAALDAIVDGTQKAKSFGTFTDSGALAAADNNAQVHVQWLFKYRVIGTGALRTISLGTADLDLTVATTTPDGKTYAILDPTSAEWTALKAAWDAYVMEDANTTELLQVYVRE